MFNYKILPINVCHTYLCGLNQCFDALTKNNSGWCYELLDDDAGTDDAHLTILDFTSYAELDDLTDTERQYLCKEKGYKILVLLKSSQTKLISELYHHSTCSVLSTDERLFRVRELVDSSLKKRRFISVQIVVSLQHPPVPEALVSLTTAEIRVLSHLRHGKRGQEISKELFRSQKTISTHKRSIMKKLGVSNEMGLLMKIKTMEQEPLFPA